MRRLAHLALAAATVAACVSVQAANAANPCNGTVDTNCDYYDSQGNLRHCDVWIGNCPSVSINLSEPRGTCDGFADVDCYDPNHCNLWVWSVGCVIG